MALKEIDPKKLYQNESWDKQAELLTTEEMLKALKTPLESRELKYAKTELAVGIIIAKAQLAKAKPIIEKQLIPDGWGNVGIDFRLYPGGVECIITYITESGLEESKGFAKAPRNKKENYDRQSLAKEASRQALQSQLEGG